MATNTLIQSLNAGDTLPSNRRQVETFRAGAAITAGDAVAFDLSQTEVGDKFLFVKQLDSADTKANSFVGIALTSAAAAGEKVEVVISGPAEASVATGVAQGDALEASAVKGRLALYANTSVSAIAGVAAAAESSNKALVIVKKQF
jgi:hypothetical protein